MARLSPFSKFKWTKSDGTPLSGGKVHTYDTGTSTNKTTYTDRAAGTPNANPVVLDSNGEANIWLDTDSRYRFVIKDADDVTLATIDDLTFIPESGDFTGLSNIVEDLTPQLGGNLDLNSKSIITTSNADILLTPNGTGTVVVGTDLDVDNINVDGNTIKSTDTAGAINITPDTTGDLVLDGLKWPQSDGTTGQFIKTDGSAQLAFASASGKVLQMVFATTTTAVGDTTNIPHDDTIPQNTEGTELITKAITPVSGTSNLMIDLFIPVLSCDAVENITFALFKDTDVNAIQVGSVLGHGTETMHGFLRYIVLSSDTTARTYKIRFGSASDNSDVLREGSNLKFSTADAVFFSIMEIEA